MSCAIIVYIVRLLDYEKLAAALLQVNPVYLAGAFVLPAVGILISVARWHTLLRLQGIDIQFGFLLRSIFVGRFFNTFLPSTIGGDAMRMLDLFKAGVSKSAAVSTTLIDRGLGLLALASFGGVAFLTSTILLSLVPQLQPLKPLVLAAVCAVFLAFAFFLKLPQGLSTLLRKILPAKLHGTVSVLETLQRRPLLLLWPIALSFLLQINVILFYYLLSLAFDLQIEMTSFFVVIPAVLFAMMLPVSINGIGIKEGVFIFAFGLFGIPTETIIAYTLLTYVDAIVNGIIGGIVYALRD